MLAKDVTNPKLRRGSRFYWTDIKGDITMMLVMLNDEILVPLCDGDPYRPVTGKDIGYQNNNVRDLKNAHVYMYPLSSTPHKGYSLLYDDSEYPYCTPKETYDAEVWYERVFATKRRREIAKNFSGMVSRRRMTAKYPYLTPIPDDASYGSMTKYAMMNIRAELKHEFPGVKFSVSKGSARSNSGNISWTDGPLEDDVKRIVNKYGMSHIDQTDAKITNSSWFNKVFGGCDFIFCNRKFSDEAKHRMTMIVRKEYPELVGNSQSIYHEHVRHVEPQDHGLLWFSIGDIVNYRLNNTDMFKKPKPKKTQKKPSDDHDEEIVSVKKINKPSADVEVVDYSDKAIAVFGDIRPISAELEKLGGKYNARLTKDGQRTPGYIFSKRREKSVRDFIEQVQDK